MNQPLIQATQLSIQAGDHLLLEEASFSIYQDEITLLVGASGSGKTVLLKILAGLIGKNHRHFQIVGKIHFDGKSIFSWQYQKKHPVGIVFQDYGLFDNYSIAANLDFAFAHSREKLSKAERKQRLALLLEQLGINPNLSIRHASGGQKRRISIARTLAYNPEVLIYDEPISGLDPQMSGSVAQLICETHRTFNKKSSIIVTHDYEEFLPLVDRVLFFDPRLKQIYQVSPTELRAIIAEGRFQVPAAKPEKTWWGKCKKKVASFLIATSTWSLFVPRMLWQAFWRLLPLWRSPKWGVRFFMHYLRLTSFISSILYVATAGAIIGFVTAYFSFKFLPYKRITESLITAEVLEALGYGLYRIIIPIMVSVLIAARCGSAVASDIGNRVYLQESDSMRSMRASPSAYLQTSIIYAFLLAVPLLTFITFFVARIFCLAAFTYMQPNYNLVLADSIFHGMLREVNEPFFRGTEWILYKSTVCGFGIANICYYVGINPKSSARDISHDITLTVILATLFVMIAHFVFALLEF